MIRRAICFAALVVLTGAIPAGAVVTLDSQVFYGGAGDQGGRDVEYAGNNELYVSALQGSSSHLVKYSTPTTGLSSPTWARSWSPGKLTGVATSGGNVYAAGSSHPSQGITLDGVGGQEGKGIVAEFNANGSNGPGPGGSVWTKAVPVGFMSPSNSTNYFLYSGSEGHNDATTTVEGGNTYIYTAGGGQPWSYAAYIIGKYDSAGNLVNAATDSTVGIKFDSTSLPLGPGASGASGIAELNGNLFAAGVSAWNEGTPGDTGGRVAIWKYDSNLNLLHRERNTDLNGDFYDVTEFGGAIYAVGYERTGVVYDFDFLIEKFDESGSRVWSTSVSNPGEDFLYGVVGLGGQLYAVGSTTSMGAGGKDMVVLEIDPTTGSVFSTNTYGGALDDIARAVTTDGTDLYVVGETRSYGVGGNVVGQNDVTLLRLTTTVIPEPSTLVLLSMGAVGLLLYVWRKHRRW